VNVTFTGDARETITAEETEPAPAVGFPSAVTWTSLAAEPVAAAGVGRVGVGAPIRDPARIGTTRRRTRTLERTRRGRTPRSATEARWATV